jgi:hypothetical protein
MFGGTHRMLVTGCSTSSSSIKAPLQNGDIYQKLQSHRLTQIPAPVLREIKQVEMYTKFWKFIPEEFRYKICPRPSQQVLENIKKTRSKKAKAKTKGESEEADGDEGSRGRFVGCWWPLRLH